MGQSVEWSKLPFELDSIGQASVLSSIQTARYKEHKNVDTSYRRNANLYSSIMGTNTKRSINASTDEASMQQQNKGAALSILRMSQEVPSRGA